IEQAVLIISGCSRALVCGAAEQTPRDTNLGISRGFLVWVAKIKGTMKLTSLKSLLKSREILFSATTGLSLLLGIFSGFILSKMPFISLALFVNAYFFGSYFMLRTVWKAIWTLSFDVDLLMFVAAIGAAILGKWEEGSLLLFLFSLGHALEKHALEKANRSIAALAELSPQTALVKKGETIME